MKSTGRDESQEMSLATTPSCLPSMPRYRHREASHSVLLTPCPASSVDCELSSAVAEARPSCLRLLLADVLPQQWEDELAQKHTPRIQGEISLHQPVHTAVTDSTDLVAEATEVCFLAVQEAGSSRSRRQPCSGGHSPSAMAAFRLHLHVAFYMRVQSETKQVSKQPKSHWAKAPSCDII